MSNKLKPCGLCRGCGRISSARFGRWFVECINCGVTTSRYSLLCYALTAWDSNTLKMPSSHGKKVSLLVNLIKKKTKRELPENRIFTKEDVEKATKAAFEEGARVSFNEGLGIPPMIFFERITKAALNAIGKIENNGGSK